MSPSNKIHREVGQAKYLSAHLVEFTHKGVSSVKKIYCCVVYVFSFIPEPSYISSTRCGKQRSTFSAVSLYQTDCGRLQNWRLLSVSRVSDTTNGGHWGQDIGEGLAQDLRYCAVFRQLHRRLRSFVAASVVLNILSVTQLLLIGVNIKTGVLISP